MSALAHSGSDYLKLMLNSHVYDVAQRTRLDFAPRLSRQTGNEVFLKREDEQVSFSFKVRGAYNKMAHMTPEELERGVVAASAGNHAQGVALAAQRLGARATIVAPVTTPDIKKEAIRALGATLILHGDSYSEAAGFALQLAQEQGLAHVHPYDDPLVIAGQGTIGLEILEAHKGPLDAVFVAVGGGGLISGVGAAIKQLRPEVRVIGVEPEDSNAMSLSLQQGRRIVLEHVGMLADGVAVKQVGEETFRVARQVVDEVIEVSNDEICAAVKDVFECRRAVLEPAGALGYAGLKRYVHREGITGRHLVAIACGANVNFDRLRYVSERAEIGERREAILAVQIPERPGSFLEFCRLVGGHSITEFNYRMSDPERATVFVGLHLVGEHETVISALRGAGYDTVDLTGDEMAKMHVRHMVGGLSPYAVDERLFRFAFPERPGALLGFLEKLSGRWNISLFHYRNHGSDVGRALVGIQVPKSTTNSFESFCRGLELEWSEETDNPAYRLFLRSAT